MKNKILTLCFIANMLIASDNIPVINLEESFIGANKTLINKYEPTPLEKCKRDLQKLHLYNLKLKKENKKINELFQNTKKILN